VVSALLTAYRHLNLRWQHEVLPQSIVRVNRRNWKEQNEISQMMSERVLSLGADMSYLLGLLRELERTSS
jgi:hypothetical protein